MEAATDGSAKLRRLSSALTALAKFGFTTAWIAGGAMLLARVAYTRGDVPGLAIILWLFVSVLVWMTCARLKAVSADDRFLHVSNFRTQHRIPLAWIDKVTTPYSAWYRSWPETPWFKHHPATIHFSRDTPYGRSVAFMPRLMGFSMKQGVVKELRGMVRNARVADPG